MDERISKALAELKRAGISLPQLVSEAARRGETFSNDEVMDVVWAVSEQRGYERAVEELGVDGKSGKKPKNGRLEVLKWMELQYLLTEVLGLEKSNGLDKYRPKGLASLVDWLRLALPPVQTIFGIPRREPLYDTMPFPGLGDPPRTTNLFTWNSSNPPRQQ